ncbi:MAG TPA: histidine kinase, partial [Candidatus Limnocylindrales bacterium]|nr:histidine kinase [Candidatus Limnocylindrales bacterium]
MANDTATTAASGIADLTARLAGDLVTLDKELGEIDLLISQARNEAARHEGKRSIAADRFDTLTSSSDITNRLEQATALIAMTKRAALMETQVEVLEGKRRTLARYRDGLADYVQALAAVDPSSLSGDASVDLASDAPMPANVARVLMAAQEDLRREISRAMHDGPAQSLTNIVLQAQIVERLVASDPAA